MTGREAFAALDEELDRLPAIYREPLVLCYLQGLTRDQAAGRLGVPSATLKGQLDRGRKKLADALTRRGIDIGAGLIAIAATSSARASSPGLIDSILATVGGSPSASVAAIAKGIAMNGFSLKAKLLALAAVTLTGFGLATVPTTAGPQKPANERTKQPAAKEDAKSNARSSAEQPVAKSNEPKFEPIDAETIVAYLNLGDLMPPLSALSSFRLERKRPRSGCLGSVSVGWGMSGRARSLNFPNCRASRFHSGWTLPVPS
jgi:Sigma-70, region 4